MVFTEDYPNIVLLCKPKILKQILMERSLWKNLALDSRAFFLDY